MRLYGDNGKENGNYYFGFWGLGFRVGYRPPSLTVGS